MYQNIILGHEQLNQLWEWVQKISDDHCEDFGLQIRDVRNWIHSLRLSFQSIFLSLFQYLSKL